MIDSRSATVATLDAGRASAQAVRLPFALIACIAVACLLNLLWIHLNVAPPRSWDDAEYLADSVSTYQAIERGEMGEFLRAASRPARGVHPPMTKLAPLPMYVLFGPGTRSALYAYTALIPVFCVYLFLLARLVTGSDRTAVLAVVVTCCFPLTFGLWRLVMAEFGLAVAVVAAQYHLLRAVERSAGSVHPALAGAFMGWGMLWKVSLPVFMAGPLCYVVVRHRAASTAGTRRWGLRTVTVMGLAAACVAAPFYLLRFGSLWRFVRYNTSPTAALEQFALGPVLSPVTVLKYWSALIDFGTSGYMFVLGSTLLGVALARRRLPLPRSGAWFVVSCGVLPLMFFSFQYLKEPRHLFPAFAMAGIVLAALLADTIGRVRRTARLAAIAGVLAFPVYQFIWLSFDVAWGPSRDVRLGPVLLLAGDRASLFVRPANRTPWPVDEIVATLAAHSEAIEGRPPRVRIAGHIPFLDGPGLNYASLLRNRLPLVYSMLGDRSLHATWWDFVLVLSGPLRDPSEYREDVLEQLLANGRLPFGPVGRVALPAGSEALLYRASPTASIASGRGGDNLVTAADVQGQPLFPVARDEWDLPTGPHVVAVPSRGMPVEFPYVYVPEDAALLTWDIVKRRGEVCGESEYAVTVADLSSRRGPAHSVASAYRVPAARDVEAASLDLTMFRGRIVTIGLSVGPAAGRSQSCLGWTGLRIVT